MTRRKMINDVISVAESMGHTFLGDEYKNNRIKMPFNCPKHGVFFATYYGLTKGGGCPIAFHKFCGGYSCPTSFKQLEKFKIKVLRQKVGDSG